MKIKLLPIFNFTRNFIFLAVLGTAACTPSPGSKPEPQKIVATTGEFTPKEEAIYQQRFVDMIEAFRTGADSTSYAIEAPVGAALTAASLKRGPSKILSTAVIEDVVQYARDNRSDTLVIYEKGQIVAEDYFGENDIDTLMVSKSLSKPLGTLAIGRAIELGFIKSLDQAVSDFVIEWKGTDKNSILIRHLLEMRSGLLSQSNSPDPDSVLNRAYLHPRHDEVIIHEYPLVDTPGTRYEYLNANSELVSTIIKRATGMSYPEFLAAQVLAPLGSGGGMVWVNRAGGTAHSGCCIRLPGETYLKMAILIMQKGVWDGERLLSEDFINQMITPTAYNKFAGMSVYVGREYKKDRGAGNPDTPSYTAVFHSEPYVDKDILLFDGNGNQVIYILPSRGIIIMRLGRSPKKDPGKKDSGWDNAYILNAISRALDAN